MESQAKIINDIIAIEIFQNEKKIPISTNLKIDKIVINDNNKTIYLLSNGKWVHFELKVIK
jgi:hypothetical protein